MADEKLILGIWDGHDAGAALVKGDRLLSAVNEERLSRRKLEVGFPEKSIAACLQIAGVRPADLSTVALSTSDFSKTLTRVFPKLKEEYYQMRRRKKVPGLLYPLKKAMKYRLTELPSSAPTRWLSRRAVARQLASLGLGNVPLVLVDHHAAHAADAAFCSGFERALVLTIDGIGDGLSGSIWRLGGGKLERLAELSGRSSFGIFFEHVTNLMNMRELEDEGKVMALANYAYPVPDAHNAMLDFFSVDGLRVRCRYSSMGMYRELKKLLWRFPPEQFAYMAQRTLEVKIVELVREAVRVTGERNIAYAGGVASNVKVNMLLREMEGVDELFVFPHMGDGGLAAGAALWLNYERFGVSRVPLPNVYAGPGYGHAEIEKALAGYPQFAVRRSNDVAAETAALIAGGEILMWFQGRMEFGPRALGSRSILARPDSIEMKDALNLRLKRRVWYQPFCPSMLDEDAWSVLERYDGKANPFMTCAYRTKREKRHALAGVVNVDGTCRPQILRLGEQGRYADLLRRVKELTGFGIVLNTSFNLHGEPLVCSPLDALKTFAETDVNYIILDDLIVSKQKPEGR